MASARPGAWPASTFEMLIDTHAHLCDPGFDDDLEAVLGRALEAGVTGVVAVGETLEDAEKNLELSRRHPATVLPAAGLYPTHLDLEQAARIEAWIRRKREHVVAIGEVGLDHWKVREEADRQVQREIFARAIALSLELDLPLNVHSRSAGRHAIRQLVEHGARRVQLHAFDGKASAALPGVEAGYFFSIPPSVVRSRQKQKLVRHLPPSSLLVETDSPVLAPVPGERNEPANARVVLAAVAEIKGMPEKALAEIVADNTRRLYGAALDRTLRTASS